MEKVSARTPATHPGPLAHDPAPIPARDHQTTAIADGEEPAVTHTRAADPEALATPRVVAAAVALTPHPAVDPALRRRRRRREVELRPRRRRRRTLVRHLEAALIPPRRIRIRARAERHLCREALHRRRELPLHIVVAPEEGAVIGGVVAVIEVEVIGVEVIGVAVIGVGVEVIGMVIEVIGRGIQPAVVVVVVAGIGAGTMVET